MAPEISGWLVKSQAESTAFGLFFKEMGCPTWDEPR